MDVLDLKGPEFLSWYLVAFLIAGGAFFVFRYLLRRSGAASPCGTDVDPYEIGWLEGEATGVLRAALASLHQRKLLHVFSGAGVGRQPIDDDEVPPLDPVEADVFAALGLGPGQ